MAAQGQAHTWRSTLDKLRAALASPMPHGLVVQAAIAHLPPIEAEADPEGLRAELAGLLGTAAGYLLRCDLAGLLEQEPKPWSMILLLVANTSSLSQACELLLERAQLADSKTQYTLLSASLAYVTGGMLGVQRQLASSAAGGRAGGSSCPAAALLPCLPLLGRAAACNGARRRGVQRFHHVLSANTAALPAAFGCILLKRLSEVLALASALSPSAAASGSAPHSPEAASSTPHHSATLHSAAAALARTAAKPAVLLPLLAQLLPCVEGLRNADRDDNDATGPAAVPTIATVLLTAPDFKCQFEAAVRQDAALQEQMVLACLTALECGLQRLDASTACGSADGGRSGSPATTNQPGSRQQGPASSSSAAAAVQPYDDCGWEDVGLALSALSFSAFNGGVRVVAAGPRSAQLFDIVAAGIERMVSPAAGQHFGDRPVRLATACQALPVVSFAYAGQLRKADSGIADRREVAWKAMGVLPDAMAALRQVAAGSGSRDKLAPTVAVSLATLAEAQPLQQAQPMVRLAADVAVWCETATAVLRLLPLLLQLLPQLRVNALVTTSGTVGRIDSLPSCLLGLVTERLVEVNEFNVRLTATEGGQVEAVEAQAEPLFLLHSTAVRFVHWLCSLDEAQLAAVPELGSWDAWHTLVHVVFTEAVGVHRMGRTQAAIAGDAEQEALFTRRLHSLCLAHAPLVPIISEKTGRAFDNPDLGFFTELLFMVAYTPTAALDPQLTAAFERSVRSSLQAPPPHGLVEEVWEAVHKWLVEAEVEPQYCVFLLTSGLAQQGLAAAEAAAVANDMPLPSIARRLLATVHVCCCNLGATTPGDLVSAMWDPSAAAAASPHAAAISAAHAGLSAALRPMLTRFPPPPSLELLQRYRAAVTAAAALAAALQAYWHSPEQLQAGRLAAARAAAARSCAYLRCANLGGGGGARTGTGAGSSRCSACRVAWYCGTACSHADWRAGHKRMCKLLGQARLAEKAAAAEL